MTVPSLDSYPNFVNSSVQINVHFLKNSKIILVFCLYHLFEGEGREDELMVFSPCCSCLISLQLGADSQNAVSTDWVWHISLVIM